MKNDRFCFALTVSCLFWFIFAVPAISAERGIVPVPVKDKGGKEVLLYRESHALVIGASEYNNGWPKLPGVADDAREVKTVLEEAGFNVTVVMDPDRDKLEKAFTDFINERGQGRDNRLLFYFAGHGYTTKLEYGAEMGYIVPVDAPDPNRDKAGFLKKAMDMQMVEVYARRIQSKHAVFLFDSCFSGSLFALTRAIPQVIQEKTALPVRQFITAGTANQEVPDESLFRRMFARALRGDGDLNKDGYVTVTELGQYLEDTVTNYSKRSQTPKYGKIRDPILDQGDFVFPLAGAIAPRKSADLEQERRNVEKERIQLEEERKRLEAEKKLEEERRKLAEERQKLARLEPAKPAEKPSPGPPGMVTIPGGTFYAGLQDEKDNPARELDIGTFKMDQYEVTQTDYEKIMGSNPSHFKNCPNCPVEQVTWHEADAYCRKAGKRLPTEWEWEKAARAGTTTAYYWGNEPDSSYGWWRENSDEKTHPVGVKKPNGYGLYDMAGNVWEWTASDYKSGRNVLRGGAWSYNPVSARPAYRLPYDPDRRFDSIGFRCAQDAGEKSSLAEERDRLARLEPPKAEDRPQTSGKCPSKMASLPAGRLASENISGGMSMGGFCMDQYEVTQGEYERAMGSNPSHFKNCPNCPVEQVTWSEADAYCRKAGKRLPTEWEWEYAAKGGTTTTYYWGNNPDDAYGWWSGNSGDKTHPVSEKKPNGYGLYDMAGNVWEWTASDYGQDSEYEILRGKVLRGGSWLLDPHHSRPASRSFNGPGNRNSFVGFRCVQ